MKEFFYRNRLLLALPSIFLILAGVSVRALSSGITELIKEAAAPVKSVGIESLVTHIPENAIPAEGEYLDAHFLIESRKDRMNRFKCSSCHNNESVAVTGAAEMAHGNILLDHGGKEKPLDCYTCHKKENRDFLRSEKNMKIDMDHSYQMCGECHFRQKKDWVGGAHGKRIGYWAGERMIMNCTSCHDPHSPRFKKRWPKTYSPPDEE